MGSSGEGSQDSFLRGHVSHWFSNQYSPDLAFQSSAETLKYSKIDPELEPDKQLVF